jgi:hypothetical protein
MANSSSEQPNTPPQGKLARLAAEYGPLVLVVYMTISVLTIVSFAWAIERGFKSTIDGWAKQIGGWLPWLSDEGDVTGTVGTWAAAWVALKLVQPLRIAATIAITALLHRVWRARGARKRG